MSSRKVFAGSVQVEYSVSTKSKCKQCHQIISLDEIRIAVYRQSPFFDGLIPEWMHLDCFMNKLCMKKPQIRPQKSSQIIGFSDLKWDDQMTIAKWLGEPEFGVCGRTENVRKGNVLRFALRDALLNEGMTVVKEMLQLNGQPIVGGTKHMIRTCVDGLLYGALQKCPMCKKGDVHWDLDLGHYRCNGNISEWALCPFESADFFGGVPRADWQIPKSVCSPILKNWTKPDFDVPLPPPYEPRDPEELAATLKKKDAPAKGKQSEAKQQSIPAPVAAAAVPTVPKQPEKPAWTPFMKGIRFCVCGVLPKRTHRAAFDVIEYYGGTASESLVNSTRFVICDRNNQNKVVRLARARRIPIVSERFLDDCIAQGRILDPKQYDPDHSPDLMVSESEAKDTPEVGLFEQLIKPEGGSVAVFVNEKQQNPANEQPIEVKKKPVIDKSDWWWKEPEKLEGIVNPGSTFTGSPFAWSNSGDVPHSSNPVLFTPQVLREQTCVSQIVSGLDNMLSPEPPSGKIIIQNPGAWIDGNENNATYLPFYDGARDAGRGRNPMAGNVKLDPCNASFEPTPPPSKTELELIERQEREREKRRSIPLNKRAVNEDSHLQDNYHVAYADENLHELYEVVLTNSEITMGANSYYLMQLLERDIDASNGLSAYVIWTKWGRVGTKIGMDKKEPFGSLEEAVKVFRVKYEDKTKNKWEERHSFVKKPRGYYPVAVTHEDNEADAMAVTEGDAKIQSKLDQRVYVLLQQLFDAKRMQQDMAAIGVDTQKMPIGQLTEEHIHKGYETLKALEQLIVHGTGNSLQFVELSNKFYTLVSHVVPAGQTLPVIDNLELLKQKLHMVESLAEIEIAARLLRQKAPEMQQLTQNPIDVKYARMHVQLTPVQKSSREWELVERALTSTATSNSGFTVSVAHLFRVAREGEAKRFEPFSREPNRRLLWHGSRMSNLVGLLSQGIRIAPPEAPVSGYMFGKGIYLADMGGKSCEYCHATPSNPTGVVLLCEAALGDALELHHAQYIEPEELYSKGKQSCKGLGRLQPVERNTVRLETAVPATLPVSGATVPIGPEEKSGEEDVDLDHHEYIVYDVARVIIRYAVVVDFHFEENWKPRDLTWSTSPSK